MDPTQQSPIAQGLIQLLLAMQSPGASNQMVGQGNAAMGVSHAVQPDPSGPNENFRAGVKTPYGRDTQQMREHNGWLSSAQTQYANDRPIQNFRPGIPNTTWGWGRQ